MALTLQTLLPPTRSGRTFIVASFLLGLGAVSQLIVMGVFLLRAGRAAPHPAQPAISFAETLPSSMSASDTPAPPQIAPPTPAPALVNAPADSAGGDLTRPTPAAAVAPENGALGLVEQARQLRQRGDMPTALAKLREAQAAEADNPQVIAEMALTYEAMQLSDRAFEQWQRLYSLGESVGALFYLADARLHTAPGAPAANGSAGSASAARGAATGAAGNTFSGQESIVLKITDIHLEDTPDPEAEKKLVLRIVVKGRPGSAIDPTKVRILTYFYDLIDGKDIVLTDAQTGFAWVSPKPIDWANDKSEILETTYTRLKVDPAAPAPSAPPAPAPPAHGGGRRGSHTKKVEAAPPAPAPSATPAPVRVYCGYMVRLYYDRELQDVQADPIKLLEKFPPPLTLPAE